jgi:hypothetical protein
MKKLKIRCIHGAVNDALGGLILELSEEYPPGLSRFPQLIRFLPKD